MRMHANYVITDSIHIGNAEFVLGVSVKSANQFVTWKCRDTRHFEDAHFAPNLLEAQKDLVRRAVEEISRQEQLALEHDPKCMTEIVL